MSKTPTLRLWDISRRETSAILHILLNENSDFYNTQQMKLLMNNLFSSFGKENYQENYFILNLLSFPSHEVSYPPYFIRLFSSAFLDYLLDMVDSCRPNVIYIIYKTLELLLFLINIYGNVDFHLEFALEECLSKINDIIQEIMETDNDDDDILESQEYISQIWDEIMELMKQERAEKEVSYSDFQSDFEMPYDIEPDIYEQYNDDCI